jgi:Nucleotidyl transferase AbiEii toxin, Type IV TA system
MNRRQPRDVAASIRGRLLACSRETGEDFQFRLQRYASERFLYRLGESPHRGRYVLKGAMLFAIWGGSLYRATRDLDFTGYGRGETDAVIAAVREICALPVAADGLVYDASTVAAEPIRETAEYNGLRVRLTATLAAAADRHPFWQRGRTTPNRSRLSDVARHGRTAHPRLSA